MQDYEALENKFSEYVARSADCVVVCNSGTTALHLALETFELRPNSKIIIPEYTMVACARACTLAGHIPAPIDCNEADLLIDTSKIGKRIDGQTGAIMAVHVYGRRCNMQTVRIYATRHKLLVIEDMAEAHGIEIHDKTDAACYSFYRNKIIAGEEGGAIVFHKREYAARARVLRNIGFPADQSYQHAPRGINGRLSNANAKLVLDSLARVHENMARRKQVENWYSELVPPAYHMPPRQVPWVFDLRLRGLPTGPIVQELQRAGIKARHGFIPISAQQEYMQRFKHLIAAEMAREIIYLPIEPKMTRSDVAIVAENLKLAIAKSVRQHAI